MMVATAEPDVQYTQALAKGGCAACGDASPCCGREPVRRGRFAQRVLCEDLLGGPPRDVC